MYLGKTLCYGVEHAIRKLHTKFGSIVKCMDRVLSMYAVNMQIVPYSQREDSN